MDAFYARLPLIERFQTVADPALYRPAPADWWIVITDVQGSTQAIEAGRYKEVNFVGAITIAAALNAAGEVEIPFVFGGDGATLLIPPSIRPAIEAALLGVQATTAREFGLTLRVGRMEVAEAYAAEAVLQVGKFGASEHYAQAVFSGGGLAYAERVIKDPDAGRPYRLEAAQNTEAADFTGVECRWKNIESAYGETVALLVAARSDDPAEAAGVYRDVMAALEAIYGDEQRHHPVRASYLRPSFNPRRLAKLEPRVRRDHGWRRWRYVLRIWLQQVLLVLFVRFKVRTGDTQWDDYPPLIQATTDVKKFDEMLRMVLAGTPAQRDELRRYLDAQYRQGRLAYGLHAADSALMTCLVYERHGRQVHFVDGADGGYAMAAKGLKRRLKELAAVVS